jgi:diaminopimelate epimerase
MKFYKYQGCGNDFIMIDCTNPYMPTGTPERYKKLCDRHFGIGADGVIEILPHSRHDFKMQYYNADGKLGSMCGNGGRCAVRFAQFLGLIATTQTTFVASDGTHTAHISPQTVRLQMANIKEVKTLKDNEYFVETGSPHYVVLADILPDAAHVQAVGSLLRRKSWYAPTGTNVNFVAKTDQQNIIDLRTFERGVEAETLACGTGATASAAVSAYKNAQLGDQRYVVNTQGGVLYISFNHVTLGKFTDVFLEGAADYVFDGNVEI